MEKLKLSNVWENFDEFLELCKYGTIDSTKNKKHESNQLHVIF